MDGAVKKGVARDEAAYIFELVDKFAGYGFNKAHTAAYAHVAYYTAYLKANYREEFLAASMTLDAGNTDKLAMYTSEAKKSGIAILPPCINASEVDFLAEAPRGQQHGAIRYSLAALKNIGAQAVESIVAERNANGAFKDLSDFAARLNTKALNKRALETLAAAGAFDRLEANRALVHGNVEQMLAFANRLASNAAQGTGDLFGAGGAGAAKPQIDMRAAQGLDADGAAAVRVRGGRLLPLRPSARRLRERAGQARHPSLRGARGPRRPRRRGRAARRHRRLGPRAPVAEGQQVRLRRVLRAHRPVRGGDLLRDAGRLAPPAGGGHAPCCSRWRASATARPSNCACRPCSRWTRPPTACSAASRW